MNVILKVTTLTKSHLEIYREKVKTGQQQGKKCFSANQSPINYPKLCKYQGNEI